MILFYQNILNGMSPYLAAVGVPIDFEEHRHADIEISYCVCGTLDMVLNRQPHTLRAGEFALISPMTAHAFSKSSDPHSRQLTLVVGVTFLKNFFSYFTDMKRAYLLVTPDRYTEAYAQLKPLLDETAALCTQDSERNSLLLRGNLYKICAYLIGLLTDIGAASESEYKERTRVANIEKALEMIYFDHAKPLTVEDAATATGYGKSNFCKIFKEITGSTFHEVLNRQRVQSACDLLSQTALPIMEIAQQVGFSEAKTFCRIFKEVTGMTPREYRKNHA